MRKLYRSVAAILAAVMLSGSFSSCVGSFALTNRLLDWNRHIDSKLVNEIVFLAFWILPVYEVSALADLVILNSIEFWSGSNSVEKDRRASTKTVTGSDGTKYLVRSDASGYTITTLGTDETIRLEFAADDNAWDIISAEGTRTRLMTFVDDTHLALPAADGRQTIVEVSAEGLMAYRAQAIPAFASID